MPAGARALALTTSVPASWMRAVSAFTLSAGRFTRGVACTSIQKCAAHGERMPTLLANTLKGEEAHMHTWSFRIDHRKEAVLFPTCTQLPLKDLPYVDHSVRIIPPTISVRTAEGW